MIQFCPAKINIGLHIVNKREDGYHNIESLFVPIPFYDIIEFVESKKASFTTAGLPIPGNQDNNLILQALANLNKKTKLPPLSIHLHKNIPMGAGLGGGSSDATGLITAINDFFQLKLSYNEIKNIVSQVGSDCTFFIKKNSQMAENKGEELSDFEVELKDFKMLLILPAIHVSTPHAYAGIVPNENRSHLSELLKVPVRNWKTNIINDFEESVFLKNSELHIIKEDLYSKGAIYASMSGSGAAMYGIFENNFNEELLSTSYNYKWLRFDEKIY